MVDLAIAANFVRELTEDQFAERPRNGTRGIAERPRNGTRGIAERPRNGTRGIVERRRNGPRRVAAQRPRVSGSAATTGSVNGSDPAHESGPSEPTRGSRTRNETTGLRRVLARLVQVRG
jgi:hypothetical protein